MRIVTLDPGRTTGTAVITDKEVVTDQIEFNQGLIAIYQFLELQRHLWMEDDTSDPFAIIYEDFLFRQGKMKVDYYPIQVIGVINLFGEQYYCGIAKQNPAIKAFWLYNKAAKLKQLGLYKAGQPHAMDALSHGLYYVSFTMKRKDYIERLRN